MIKCQKCSQSESAIKEHQYRPSKWKHCFVCGRCMIWYSLAPTYFPEPIRFKEREYYFCSQRCLDNFFLH